jgi:hypothetical protein
MHTVDSADESADGVVWLAVRQEGWLTHDTFSLLHAGEPRIFSCRR